MNVLGSAIDYLSAQGFDTLLALFWYVIVFEVPRYLIPFVMAAFLPRRDVSTEDYHGRVSALIIGHSEADKIVACVQALREQSRPPDEIVVVSDGSTDAMSRRIADLQREGIVDKAHSTELRSGKSAGANLGAHLCTGDIIVNIDCDCSFDRHAIRNILRPFADPAVGSVSGNILARNAHASVIATFQAIEYLISISLGKQAQDRLDQVTCVSGAFGAFRRPAFEAAGGLDAGGGEDLDLTLALRSKGWRIRFAADAICYTDVPESRAALVAQRFRWERDAVRLRYRKHAQMLNPFHPNFRPGELLHEIEFLFFNVLGAVAMPVYIIWLFAMYEGSAWVILIAAQFGLLLVDTLVFTLAAAVAPKPGNARLFPYIVGYSVFYGLYMRFVRLIAYGQEWIFRASYSDSYVPDKVHVVRG